MAIAIGLDPIKVKKWAERFRCPNSGWPFALNNDPSSGHAGKSNRALMG